MAVQIAEARRIDGVEVGSGPQPVTQWEWQMIFPPFAAATRAGISVRARSAVSRPLSVLQDDAVDAQIDEAAGRSREVVRVDRAHRELDAAIDTAAATLDGPDRDLGGAVSFIEAVIQNSSTPCRRHLVKSSTTSSGRTREIEKDWLIASVRMGVLRGTSRVMRVRSQGFSCR